MHFVYNSLLFANGTSQTDRNTYILLRKETPAQPQPRKETPSPGVLAKTASKTSYRQIEPHSYRQSKKTYRNNSQNIENHRKTLQHIEKQTHPMDTHGSRGQQEQRRKHKTQKHKNIEKTENNESAIEKKKKQEKYAKTLTQCCYCTQNTVLNI